MYWAFWVTLTKAEVATARRFIVMGEKWEKEMKVRECMFMALLHC